MSEEKLDKIIENINKKLNNEEKIVLKQIIALWIKYYDRVNEAIKYIKENTFSVFDKEDNLYKDMLFKDKLLEILGDKENE